MSNSQLIHHVGIQARKVGYNKVILKQTLNHLLRNRARSGNSMSNFDFEFEFPKYRLNYCVKKAVSLTTDASCFITDWSYDKASFLF